MATVSWPSYASFQVDNYRTTNTSNVSRTNLESGLVRQARTATNTMKQITITVRLRDDNEKKAFSAWAKLHAHTFFNFPELENNPDVKDDPSDAAVTSDCRVVDGLAGIVYISRQSSPGASRYWIANMTLEKVG